MSVAITVPERVPETSKAASLLYLCVHSSRQYKVANTWSRNETYRRHRAPEEPLLSPCFLPDMPCSYNYITQQFRAKCGLPFKSDGKIAQPT